MKKVMGIMVDILLIAVVFALTEGVMLHVFQSENIWLEVGTYIVFYAIVFGGREGLKLLWKRLAHKTSQ